eukprot:13910702-Alexandrium_andersonii.AAC.1
MFRCKPLQTAGSAATHLLPSKRRWPSLVTGLGPDREIYLDIELPGNQISQVDFSARTPGELK